VIGERNATIDVTLERVSTNASNGTDPTGPNAGANATNATAGGGNASNASEGSIGSTPAAASSTTDRTGVLRSPPAVARARLAGVSSTGQGTVGER